MSHVKSVESFASLKPGVRIFFLLSKIWKWSAWPIPQTIPPFQVWQLPFWLLETTWPKWLVNLADSFGFAIFASTLSTTRGTWRSILLENMLPSSVCHALMKNVNQFSLINLILTTTFTKSILSWWKGIGCFLAEPKYPAIITLLLSSNGSF